MIFVPAIIAFVVAWIVIAALVHRSDRLPTDLPNARSLHERAVPRGGGLAIWAGWLGGTLWLPGPKPWLWPLLAMIAVSLWDDHRHLPAILRLLVHLAAALAWVAMEAPPINYALAVLAIVWMANLYNFMDGSDGLAGTMTVAGFSAYAIAAWIRGSGGASIFLALVAATLPFLWYNKPPARIFLGDVGAVPLGFLAAVFGMEGWQAGAWAAWFPLLVFLPFIADATATLGRRLWSGARVWEAHREHHYQRLVQLGFGHRGTLALYACLMVTASLSAVAMLAWKPTAGVLLLAGWVAAFALLFVGIGYHWRRRKLGFNESKN